MGGLLETASSLRVRAGGMGIGQASKIETPPSSPSFPFPPCPPQFPSPRAAGSSRLPSPPHTPPHVTSFLFGACCCSPCSSIEYLAGPRARTGAVAPLCVGAMRILANKTRCVGVVEGGMCVRGVRGREGPGGDGLCCAALENEPLAPGFQATGGLKGI